MYFNTLIIMNEETLGYGNRSRKPSGYCKLTMPNRIICYVQGLRQLPKGQMYRLYLTSREKEQSIEVGMFQVGPSGNKETRWVMDPANINNSELNAKEIDGALIVIDGEDDQQYQVPLVGFSSDPYNWEHLIRKEPLIFEDNIRLEEAEIEVGSEPEPKLEQESEPELELEPEPKLERESEPELESEAEVEEVKETKVVQDNSFADEIADEILSLRNEIRSLKRTIEESKVAIEELQIPKEDEKIEEVEPKKFEPEKSEQENNRSGVNDYINSFIRKFQGSDKTPYRNDYQNIQRVFEKRIPINPFEAQSADIKWVRITHDDLASFSSLDDEWVNQSLIMEANRDYKHFILGRDQTGLTYYVGIPGIFDPYKDDPLKLDKIERFSCCHNTPPVKGEAGYWIAMI